MAELEMYSIRLCGNISSIRVQPTKLVIM